MQVTCCNGPPFCLLFTLRSGFTLVLLLLYVDVPILPRMPSALLPSTWFAFWLCASVSCTPSCLLGVHHSTVLHKWHALASLTIDRQICQLVVPVLKHLLDNLSYHLLNHWLAQACATILNLPGFSVSPVARHLLGAACPLSGADG